MAFKFQAILVVAVAASCMAASYGYYSANVSRLSVAAENLRRCQTIATQIAQARQLPQRARLETSSQDDLGSVVEKAAAESQLGRDRVLRIDPQPGKRLGKTDYLEQATEVELFGATLRQLVDFTYNVTRSDDKLSIVTLRLRAPHDAANATSQELWLADIVLTQRIFAPAANAK